MLLALGLVVFLLTSVFGLEISRRTSGYYTPVAVKDLRLAVEPTNWTGEQTEGAASWRSTRSPNWTPGGTATV